MRCLVFVEVLSLGEYFRHDYWDVCAICTIVNHASGMTSLTVNLRKDGMEGISVWNTE
jgi:hypothetical protein